MKVQWKAAKWKLTGEKIKYLEQECHKAVLKQEEEEIIAWFAPAIPVKVGPSNYHGLPGAILMVTANDGDLEIRATHINLSKIDNAFIVEPDKGKRVSSTEFERIEEEKLKQFEQMNGGGNVIIRRGPGAAEH